MRAYRPLLLLLALLPAACGDLPEPFRGNPGATARVLALPPTPRLAVPTPRTALLSDAAANSFAQSLAAALQSREVPAVPGPAQQGDWRLDTTATLHGDTVTPIYKVIDPTGKERGESDGAPVPSAAWANAVPTTLSTAATQAAPSIASLLTSIQHADPNSLYNRAARVDVPPVTGAPGDGNLALTTQIRSLLTKLGVTVQDTPANADFIVQGQVKVVPIAGKQQRVEIQWYVTTPTGDERGRVVQLNNVPAGSLDGYWGDVATAVAQEAAGGVHDVILRQSGRDPNAPAAPPPAAKPAQK